MELTILIISQDTFICKIIEAQTRKHNYNTMFASTLVEATVITDNHQIHAVLIDIAIDNKKDLLTVIEKIKKKHFAKTIPVIILKDEISENNLSKDNSIKLFNRNLSDFNQMMQFIRTITNKQEEQTTNKKPEIKANKSRSRATSRTIYTETDELPDPTQTFIAMADDSKPIRKFVSGILKEKNYNISEFENGQLLLDYLNLGKHVDIVILDNQMPVKGGIETLQEMKNSYTLKNIPVLFVSAVTDKDQVVKALELGADDYIAKPFHNNEFFARLNVHLKIDLMKKKLINNNVKITEQNNQITDKLEEIQAQAQKLTEYNRIVKEKNDSITASINYAKRIQDAVLPPKKSFENDFSKTLIYYKPRDIVSGDFYWYKKIGNKCIFAAADCTGHGVPGAFMSMLGISYLNEVTGRYEEQNIKANEILNDLRDNVKRSLHQTGKSREAKDGMDISLVIIDKENMKLQFSGAFNPMFLLRDKKDNYEQQITNPQVKFEYSENSILIQVKADKMPIGIHFKEKGSFTNYEIDIQQNDTIYLLSDGYADQFGGNHGRKFMLKNLKSMLLEICNKPMNQQYELLEKTFNSWRGDRYKQVDDVMVLGIRI